MLVVTVVFTLATVILAMASSHILGIIDGNEEAIGLPAGFTGLDALLALVIGVIAAGVLIAPLAQVVNSYRARSRRPTRRR